MFIRRLLSDESEKPRIFCYCFYRIYGIAYSSVILDISISRMNYFIVSRGVSDGIERASNILMPLLFVILIAFCVRSLFLPGAKEGLFFLVSSGFFEDRFRSSVTGYGAGIFFIEFRNGHADNVCFLFFR